jgi:hypothetical protein
MKRQKFDSSCLKKLIFREMRAQILVIIKFPPKLSSIMMSAHIRGRRKKMCPKIAHWRHVQNRKRDFSAAARA